MAKRKSTQIIDPFPETIDRNRFGDWLSGFADGEGCFILYFLKTSRNKHPRLIPRATFDINLRADDRGVLELIRSFWGCGYLNYCVNVGNNGNPQWRFQVATIPSLTNVIVPHFEKYPLRAKKANDFAIWKEAVALLSLHYRPHTDRPFKNRGWARIWTDELCARFDVFRCAMNAQRSFVLREIAPKSSPKPEPTLFDGLSEDPSAGIE